MRLPIYQKKQENVGIRGPPPLKMTTWEGNSEKSQNNSLLLPCVGEKEKRRWLSARDRARKHQGSSQTSLQECPIHHRGSYEEKNRSIIVILVANRALVTDTWPEHLSLKIFKKGVLHIWNIRLSSAFHDISQCSQINQPFAAGSEARNGEMLRVAAAADNSNLSQRATRKGMSSVIGTRKVLEQSDRDGAKGLCQRADKVK